jgi:putative copper resistance protein D
MTGLSIAIRSLHLAASLFLVGLFAFLLMIARPAFRTGKAEESSTFRSFDVHLLRFAGWSLLVLLLTGFLGMWVQLAAATGRPLEQVLTFDALGSLLANTQYGRVWVIRMALMTLLGCILWLRDQERDRKDWWALRLEVAGLALCILVAQACIGHSATGEGMNLVFQVLADSVHLVATGVWLGSLPVLALLLAWGLRSNDRRIYQVAAEAIRRFSILGLASMSLLILSGLANAWELVGTVPALVGTTYGRVLLLKVSLLLPLLAIAALNLLYEVPRLWRSEVEPAPADARPVLRRLRRNILGELLLGIFIILLVGALGVMPPALHEQPTWPFSFRLSWEAAKDMPGVRSSVAAGIQVSMFGFFAALIARISRVRRWPWIVAAGLVTGGLGFALWLPKLSVDAYPTTYVRPIASYNVLSIANGLQLYGQYCAICHGPEGYGNGPAAAGLRPRPADFTAKHTADHTAGDLFWWLTHGKQGTAMPGYRDRLSEEERWDLINMVRTLSAAEQARPLGPIVSADLRVVAPDFSYITPFGEPRALKDFRGHDQVLLVFFSLPQSRQRLMQLQGLYSKIRPLGVEILSLPLQPDEGLDAEVWRLSLAFPLIRDGASEAAAVYALFRRSLSPEVSGHDSSMSTHLEFLVDRQGYLRGRWVANEGVGWGDSEQLLTAIDVLLKEKRPALPPDLHVH